MEKGKKKNHLLRNVFFYASAVIVHIVATCVCVCVSVLSGDDVAEGLPLKCHPSKVMFDAIRIPERERERMGWVGGLATE